MTQQLIQQQAHLQNVCQSTAAAKSTATAIKPDANGYEATTTAAKPGSHSSTAGVCQEVDLSPE